MYISVRFLNPITKLHIDHLPFFVTTTCIYESSLSSCVYLILINAAVVSFSSVELLTERIRAKKASQVNLVNLQHNHHQVSCTPSSLIQEISLHVHRLHVEGWHVPTETFINKNIIRIYDWLDTSVFFTDCVFHSWRSYYSTESAIAEK